MSRSKPTSRPAPRPKTDADSSDHRLRLQKALASAGLGSRRHCEELITEGRVEVDRQIVNELGAKVDPAHQEIKVDGTLLPRPKLVYFAVNKPVGVVSTNRDPSGRPRVVDLVPGGERLFTVGRLDLSSEGLIIVTNDGELANMLTHPRYGVEKVYHALVAGEPDPSLLEKLKRGVRLAEGFAHVAKIRVRKSLKQSTLLEMTLDEGRNRELRRLLARIGHKVLKLKRIAVGPLRLGELAPGDFRALRREDVQSLRKAAIESRKQQQRSGKVGKPQAASTLPDAIDDDLVGASSEERAPRQPAAGPRLPTGRAQGRAKFKRMSSSSLMPGAPRKSKRKVAAKPTTETKFRRGKARTTGGLERKPTKGRFHKTATKGRRP